MRQIAKTKKPKATLEWVERSLAKMQADRERDAEERRKAEAKAEEEWAKLRAAIAETNSHLGDYTQGEGEMLEQEYIAALRKEKRIGDIVIHEVLPNVGDEFQFDAALPNGEIVIVAEFKRRFTLAKLRKFAKDRLPRFAKVCPWIAGDRKIVGAIGGGSISQAVREEAKNLGLIIMTLENRKLVVQNTKGARAV